MIAAFAGLAFFAALALMWSFVGSLRPVTLTTRLVQSDWAPSFGLGFRGRVFRFAKATFEPRQRMLRVLFELPDFLELLSVALSSGESIYAALRRVVPRISGILGTELAAMLRALEFGSDLEFELSELAERLPQQQVVEMCNKLTIALRRGTPLSRVLAEQAQAVRQEVSNQLLKRAGKNETRMLIPLVFLILPVTILFAIYPSLQLLNMSYL